MAGAPFFQGDEAMNSSGVHSFIPLNPNFLYTKILFYAIFVESKQSCQMLFTRSKNIDSSRIYRIFKIAKYIQ